MSRPHSFSKSFALAHTVHEAVILKHLAYKVAHSNKWRNDKQWYYDSTKELAKKMPYLSPSAIDSNIRKLGKKPALEIGCFNKWKQDKTRWFHVPIETRNQVDKDLIRFDPDDAQAHGISAAVLLFNLRFWIKKKLKKATDTNVAHEMSPSALSKHLPYSISTIKAALKTLEKAGAIVRTSPTKSEFSLPPFEMQQLRREAKLKS